MASFEKLIVYRLAEELADVVWDIAREWPAMARDTVGKQMVRSADSISANIAEGYGRGSYQDNRRFVRIARGSLCETKSWLRRAYRRGLLTEAQIGQLQGLTRNLGPALNGYLKSIGKKAESRASTTVETND